MNQMMQGGLPTYDDAANLANQARFAMDHKLYVQFYIRPVMNNFRSSEEGRPIYEEKEYIRIIVPGDSKTTVDCPVDDTFRMRFEKQYDKFKKGLAQAVEGTPLEMWPQMTVGLCAELKAMNISTVEQLASLDDGKAQKIMGSHDLRRRAQAFLEASKGEAVNNKMVAELEKRDDEIALLKQQMAQLLEATKAKPNTISKA
jgi:hypothetical protein